MIVANGVYLGGGLISDYEIEDGGFLMYVFYCG
jgi:hypothetical protein